MPRTERELAKRKFDQVLNALDRALTHLQDLRALYDDRAPKHREFVENAALGILNIRDMIEEFRKRFV